MWNVPPWSWHPVEIWENLLFHALSNDACKFAINLFPFTWGPFENVNLLYVLLKIQIWNGCNVLNIAGNPIKDIKVNLSCLSSRSKVVECTPSKVSSSRNFGKSTFPCFNNWKYNVFAIFNGRQKKFGEERPFTHEGNYQVIILCTCCFPNAATFSRLYQTTSVIDWLSQIKIFTVNINSPDSEHIVNK